jgi:PGF-CTERM protein
VKREATLAALGLLVVIGAILLTVMAPGAVAERSEDLRPSDIDLREPRVAAGEVGGETAELVLDVRLNHRGGAAENVTVEVQAVDTETGLVATTVRRDLGRVAGEREVRRPINVTVPREGGYRMFIRVYENGTRVATGATEVSGVDSLTPAYAATPIEFHSFGSGDASPPVIGYAVAETSDERTTLRTRTHLTNRGDETAGGLELVVTARQVESNVIADRERVAIDAIGPGRTATPTATLQVPAGYNYYLDGILLRDGVIVGTATSGAMLDPTRPVPENETTEAVEFDAGEFASTPDPPDRDTPAPTAESGTGFGVVIGLVALLIAALAATRRNP